MIPGGRFLERCVACTIFSSAAMILVLPLAATALEFAPELLVYQEDYGGELAYPTSPEIDGIAAGGLDGQSQPGTGPGPTLTGTAARASVSSTGPVADLVLFAGGTDFGLGPAGFRGESSFEIFNIPASTPFANAVVFLTGAFDVAAAFNASARASVELAQSAGVSSSALVLLETDGTGAVTTSMTLALPAAETAALEAGAFFTIDLQVDRSDSAATASVDIDGFSTHTVGPIGLSAIGATHPLDAVSQGLAFEFALPGTPNLVEVDFTGLQIFRIPTTSFVVDTFFDVVDASPGDGECLAFIGFCTLRAAIQESNASAGPGEVIVPSGIYTLTIPGAEEDATAAGDLDVTDTLILRGASRVDTVIDGGGLDRVFDIPSFVSSTQLEIMDLRIQNGAAVTSGGFRGGGIQNFGDLGLKRCSVSGNDANVGGGIMNHADLEIDDCVVSDNEVLALGFATPLAAGIASASTVASAPSAVAVIRHSAIIGNTGSLIGGIELGNADRARIENSTLSGNSGRQISIFGVDTVLQHVTVVGPAGQALAAGSASGTHTLEIANSAIEGTPACTISTVMTTHSGNNASNDTSCGFTGTNDIEDVPLGLGSLVSAGNSFAHLPTPSSVLIDAADMAFCLADDQIGTSRPMDGDGAPPADCDIGAIEVPEPSLGMLLSSGVGGLSALLCGGRRRRARIA